MPAFATHYAFANCCFDKIQQHRTFAIDKNAFMIGTQGPDIFFFHRILPLMMPGHSMRKAGSALHRANPGALFDVAAKHIKTCKEKEIAYSYFYGFILHYALDRTCHPFIYAQQHRLQNQLPQVKPFTLHNEIELALDTYMLDKILQEKQPATFHTELTFFPNERLLQEVEACVQTLLKDVCGWNLPNGTVKQAVLDTRTMQKLLHDETGAKRGLISLVENACAPLIHGFRLSVMIKPVSTKSGTCYANETHQTWRNPSAPEQARNESFLDLFDAAEQDAIKLTDGFDAILHGNACGSEITQNRSFLTGVEIL